MVLEELLSRCNKSDILEGEEEEESDIVWAAGLFEAKDGLEPSQGRAIGGKKKERKK